MTFLALFHLIVNELLYIICRTQDIEHGRVEACTLGIGKEDTSSLWEAVHTNAGLRELLWLVDLTSVHILFRCSGICCFNIATLKIVLFDDLLLLK